jgi:hypothetical protein
VKGAEIFFAFGVPGKSQMASEPDTLLLSARTYANAVTLGIVTWMSWPTEL